MHQTLAVHIEIYVCDTYFTLQQQLKGSDHDHYVCDFKQVSRLSPAQYNIYTYIDLCMAT